MENQNKIKLSSDQIALRKTTDSSNQVRCRYCGKVTQVVWVHGHGQCAYCHTNIDECCRGEH